MYCLVAEGLLIDNIYLSFLYTLYSLNWIMLVKIIVLIMDTQWHRKNHGGKPGSSYPLPPISGKQNINIDMYCLVAEELLVDNVSLRFLYVLYSLNWIMLVKIIVLIMDTQWQRGAVVVIIVW